MALPLRGSPKNGTATNGGAVTITFDAVTPPQTGDIVIVFGGHATTGTTAAGISTAGYTQIARASGTVEGGAWYKVMGGTPDTQVACVGGGNASDAVAYGCFVLDGSLVDAAIFDATATTSGPVTTFPDAPSITTVTDGAWVVAMAIANINDTSRGVPSGFTTITGATANDTSDVSCDAAYLEKTPAGAVDPPSWSTWSSAAHFAITIAIRPVTGTSVTLTGESAAASTGSMAGTRSIAASGQGATFSAGTATATISSALTSAQATFSSGTITTALSVAPAGSQVALSADTMTPDHSMSASGEQAAFSTGSVVPDTGVVVVLVGSQADYATGTMALDFAVPISGVQGDFSAGVTGPMISVLPGGMQVVFDTGTAAPDAGVIVVALVGAQAAFSTGSMTPSGSSFRYVDGVVARAAPGVVRPFQDGEGIHFPDNSQV